MVVKEVYGKIVKIDIPADVFPTPKEIVELDAVLPDCQHGWYKSVTNDVDLHYRYWAPTTTDPERPAGVVIYTHGVHSHSGHAARQGGRALDVALIVDTFTAKGMAVYARDMYGHGFSEGTRFFIPSTTDTVADLVTFIKLVADKNPPDIPLFLAGESIGGCYTILASKYFQDHPDEAPPNMDSCLLICPAIEGDLPPFPVYQILRYVLAPLRPLWRPSFMPNPISPERIWKDEEVRTEYTTPRTHEMQLSGIGIPFRLGTAVSMVLALEEVKRDAIPGLAIPLCIVHGEEDEGVPISGSQYLYDNVDTPDALKEFHCIPTAYHGLLADPKAEEAVAHLSKFVDARIKAFVPPSGI